MFKLALAALLALPSSLAALPQTALDYEKLAQTWMERNGLASAEGVEIEAVIDERFVHFPLGLFDLRVAPSALSDGEWTEELTSVFQALIDLQAEWIEWVPAPEAKRPGVPKELKSDLKTLAGWIAKWDPQELAASRPQGGSNLVEALAPKEKIQSAALSFASYMRTADEAQKVLPPSAKLIFIPDRGEFLEFVCFAGAAEPHLQPVYWARDLAHWTNFDYEGLRTLTFEFDAQDPSDYAKGLSMNFKNPTGLEQQVCQIAGRTLLDGTFGDSLDPMLAGGLANNLVLALYDEVDTRTDGDLSAKQTNATSVFVPGGLSEGGVLPGISADSRWRQDKGRGYFVENLKGAQLAGAKEVGKKETHAFELRSADESQRKVVLGPFLAGKHLEPLEPTLLGDFADFLRAYRTAFLYWLRTQAAGKKASREHFAQVLGKLKSEQSLPDILAQVYGKPLSHEDPKEESLEADFLMWLSKQK